MLKLIKCPPEMLPKMKKLYLSAFPAEERAPWGLMKRRAADGRGEALAAVDDGQFVGMAYIVSRGDMAYLFYLAVEENRRGKGDGSAIIAALREYYPEKRIFLAREQLDKSAENYPQRESRHRFYLKNGFEDWGILIKEGSVIYDVMGIGEKVTAPEYRELMRGWAGKLPSLFFKARIIE